MVRPETIIAAFRVVPSPRCPGRRSAARKDPSQRVLETAPARGGNRGGGIAPTVATAWRGGGGGVGRREAEGVPPRHRRGVPRDAQGMGAAGRLRSAGLLPDALQERPLAPGRAGGGRRGSAAAGRRRLINQGSPLLGFTLIRVYPN